MLLALSAESVLSALSVRIKSIQSIVSLTLLCSFIVQAGLPHPLSIQCNPRLTHGQRQE